MIEQRLAIVGVYLMGFIVGWVLSYIYFVKYKYKFKEEEE